MRREIPSGAVYQMVKERLAEIVGTEFVSDEEEELNIYSTDFSLSRPGKANYVVYPQNASEVSGVIKLANEFRMPVIPVSSGVHFYGSTIPSQGGIILNLRRMDNILELNETDRLLRIEPGVTWEKLCQELEKRGYMCLMPLLVHRSKSVLTSFLEREVPLNTRYEFAEPLVTMEVIWPSGEIFRTGSASTPGIPVQAAAKGANPQGPGLDWYRLLQGAQGTLGVVTWGIIKVEHLPQVNKCFFLPFQKMEQLIEPLYRIQRQMIGNECLILNKLNLATILSKEESADFNKLLEELPPWLIILILSGAPIRPEEKISYEEKGLRQICSQFPGIELWTSIPGTPGIEGYLPEILRKPWLKDGAYWKHLLKGRCSDLLFITKLDRVPEFVNVVGQIATSWGYPLNELGIYIQPLEYGRACHCEFNFYFNPQNEGEVERVQGMYLEAAKSLFNLGAHFTRPYGVLAGIAYERAASYTALLKSVKRLFDPNSVLNPGKLCF